MGARKLHSCAAHTTPWQQRAHALEPWFLALTGFVITASMELLIETQDVGLTRISASLDQFSGIVATEVVNSAAEACHLGIGSVEPRKGR